MGTGCCKEEAESCFQRIAVQKEVIATEATESKGAGHAGNAENGGDPRVEFEKLTLVNPKGETTEHGNARGEFLEVEVAKKAGVENAEDATKNSCQILASDASVVSCDFEITLRKAERSDRFDMPLKVSKDGKQVVIQRPEGAFEAWNNAHLSKAVRSGDEIIAVNGISGDVQKILNAITGSLELEVVLRRHTRIVVELTKQGNLGISFNAKGLSIRRISDGVLKQRNLTCLPSVEIFEGDVLIETIINGVSTSSQRNVECIIQKLHDASDGDDVKLIFGRPVIK